MIVDLTGLQILVTRPEAQALTWAKELDSLGAQTIVQPMLAIEALSSQADTAAIKNHVMDLDKYQNAIFVSQNAVEYGAEWIDRYWPQLPTHLNFYAVGETTAKLLENKLAHLGAIIHSPRNTVNGAISSTKSSAVDSAMNSEALLQLEGLQQIEGEQVLIFRGKGGRTHLGKSLEARGALIDYCELYSRTIPKHIDKNKISALMASKLTTVIAVHSGETLDNLCVAVDEAQLPWIKQQALLLPGERVADIAHTLGFNKLIIAANATHESMIGALNDWRQ